MSTDVTDPAYKSPSDVDDRLNAIEEKIDRILQTMDRTENMVARIVEEVKPTIDELMNSTLFKMIGMKAKK